MNVLVGDLATDDLHIQRRASLTHQLPDVGGNFTTQMAEKK